jgi:hypothetical protein
MNEQAAGIIEIGFAWKDRLGRRRQFVDRIAAQHPRAFYSPFHVWEEQVWASAEQARWHAFCARSLVAFADATGLRVSGARRAVFGWETDPTGFDHTRLWREGLGRGKHLIVTEPYEGSLNDAYASCRAHGWDYHLMPPCVGMWNPAPPICTRMLIVSPGATGIPLAPLISALEGKMPVADEGYRKGFPPEAFDPDEQTP